MRHGIRSEMYKRGEVMTGTVDTSVWEREIPQISKELRVIEDEIVRDNTALMCADLMKSTPPVDIAEGYRGSDASARRLGERAVEGDIRALVQGVKRKNVLGPANNKKFSDLVAVQTDAGDLYYIGDKELDLEGSRLAEFHKSKRSPKSGKAYRGSVRSVKIGKARRSNRLHVMESNLKKYIREKMADIGKTRAGWLAALNHFSVGALTSRYRAPSWVSRHGESMGSFTDERTEAGTFATATNSVPWIRETIVNKMVDSVLRTRARDFRSGKYAGRLQRAIDKAQGRAA